MGVTREEEGSYKGSNNEYIELKGKNRESRYNLYLKR